MNFSRIPAGKNVPHDFNIIIEIPAQSEPVKYEADKESGLLFVDRFIGTGMRYPANYGFIPHTRAGEGGPVAVLFTTAFPTVSVGDIQAAYLGLLKMKPGSRVEENVIAARH